MSHHSDDVAAAEDVETVLEEFVARDMVPEDVADEVATLQEEGRYGDALRVLLDARRDE